MINNLSGKITTALVVLGFTTLVSQLILFRELLNLFQGNELIIGLMLSLWMLFTALGSVTVSYFRRTVSQLRQLSRMLVATSITPILSVAILYVADALLFPPGTAKGILVVLLYCVLMFFPIGMLSGSLFTHFSFLLSERSAVSRISAAYGWETAGSMIAGVLFSLVFSYLFNAFQILSLVIVLNLLAARWLTPSQTNSRLKNALINIAWITVLTLLIVCPTDIWVKALMFRNQEIVYTHDTPLGNVTVTKTGGQHNIYEQGKLVFATQNPQMAEEAAHYTLLQHPRPENVLVVSGGITVMTAQVLKYKSVQHIDYVEINPWLVKTELTYSTNSHHPKVNVQINDARKWISQTNEFYDIVVVNAPDPSSAQLNRFFTLEFFRQVKKALRPQGVFTLSLSSTANYMSDEARELNQVIYATLKDVFEHVEVIPGTRNFYTASSMPVRLNIAEMADRQKLNNEYVNGYFVDDLLLLEQHRQIMNNLTVAEPKFNTDHAPLAYFLQIRYWINRMEGKNVILMLSVTIMAILLLLFPALKSIGPVTTGLFTSSFAGASAEFLVIIVYQTNFGNIYQMLGLIVALYMLGLSAGTIMEHKKTGRMVLIKHYMLVQGLLMVCLVMLPLFVTATSGNAFFPGWLLKTSLWLLTVAISFLAGRTFNCVTQLMPGYHRTNAGTLYAIDLAGSASGTLIISVLWYPLLGLYKTSFLLSALVFIGLLAAFWARKKL